MTHPLLVQVVPKGTKAVEKISPIGDFKTLEVENDNWEVVRDRVYRACLIGQRRSVIIINGHVELYEKRHQWENPARITEHGQHGLLLYMGRLLRRYGHVYVPHLSTKDNGTHEYFNNPTNAMVVGYQVAALETLPTLSGPLGRQLCRNGYDSFTVSDYFYFPMGKEVFEELGTHASWQAAYLRYFDSI